MLFPAADKTDEQVEQEQKEAEAHHQKVEAKYRIPERWAVTGGALLKSLSLSLSLSLILISLSS